VNRPLLVSTALGFTAGYVDTVGFVALFGLFAAHVTGNFVLIGSELIQASHGVAIKLLAFPAFVAAVVGARVLALLAQRRSGSTAQPLLVLQCLLLTSSMLCGWRAQPIVDPDAPWVLATGVLAAAAMGVQNAAGFLAFSQLPPTTVMTGNVTRLVIAVVDLLRGVPDASARGRIGQLACAVTAFAAGAFCGAFGLLHLACWSLAIPLLVLAVLAVVLRPDSPAHLLSTAGGDAITALQEESIHVPRHPDAKGAAGS
jgi:uncharacterized membrane protein YoaK (UPF0700 family)